MLGVFVIAPADLSAQQPTVYGPGNSSSVAFWYLGNGILSCCNGLTNRYYAQSVLTMVPQNNGNPSPSIQWSTDSPSRLSISPSADKRSAILTAQGASGYQAGYDIHVTVTSDGISSSPFPVFINTPFTMSTSAGVTYTCQQLGHPANYIGYGNVLRHSIADITGYTLTPIDVKESLEKQQFFFQTYGNGVNPPAQSSWPWAIWSGYGIDDLLKLCAPSQNALVPQPTSYNPLGGSKVFDETQKFWIGTLTNFTGVCVQRSVINIYNNHGTLNPYTTPITNKADCNQGQVIN